MKHIKSLDSLRGLAAINVFFYHIFSIQNDGSMDKPWYFFTNGHDAVILFFVLSGFILTLVIERKPISYKYYFIRRVFRIYPLYYFVILMSFIIFLCIGNFHIDGYSEWFNKLFPSTQLNKKLLIYSLLLLDDNKLDCVVWSLTHEVIISIFVLPIIWRLVKYKIFGWFFISLLFLYLHYFYLFYIGSDFINMSASYAQYFIMGVVTYYVLINLNKTQYKGLFNLIGFIFCVSIYYIKYLTFGRYYMPILPALATCYIILCICINQKINNIFNLAT